MDCYSRLLKGRDDAAIGLSAGPVRRSTSRIVRIFDLSWNTKPVSTWRLRYSRPGIDLDQTIGVSEKLKLQGRW